MYFSLLTPDVNVSFVPDVFGLNRRQAEAAAAQAEAQRFALAATHITLSANVVAAAIQQASLRAQISATRDVIASDSATVAVLHTQVAADTRTGWIWQPRNRSSRKLQPGFPCCSRNSPKKMTS